MNIAISSALAMLLVSVPGGLAQDSPAANPLHGACGSGNIQYEVKTAKPDKNHHPEGPAPDKAIVYMIENTRPECFLCDTTARFGVDGAWIGAAKGNSYFSFPIDPGSHHLCADLQFVPSSSETTALVSFTAEAGKTYYFRARLMDQNNSGRGQEDWVLDLEPLDSDQGTFLVASYALSSYHLKK